MSKYIEDDWTGEDIDLDKPFYLVNTDLVSINNLKQEEIIVYYDDNGNEYNEEDVTEFNNVEELLIFLKDRINSYEHLIEDLRDNECIKIARRYDNIKKTLRKYFRKIKIVRRRNNGKENIGG